MRTTKRSSLQNIFLVLIILVMFSFLYELIFNLFFDYYFYLSFNMSFRGLLGLIALYSWGVCILDGLGAILAGIVFWVSLKGIEAGWAKKAIFLLPTLLFVYAFFQIGAYVLLPMTQRPLYFGIGAAFIGIVMTVMMRRM